MRPAWTGRRSSGICCVVRISSIGDHEGPSGLVIVVPITTARRDLPSHIKLDSPHTGLHDMSYAKSEDVKSVSERRLIARIGVAPDEALLAVKQAIRYLLAL